MKLVSIVLAASVVVSPAGWAAGAPPSGGGIVRGTVTLKGAPPKAPPEPALPSDLAQKDRAFCSGKTPLVPPLYLTDRASHLKDVVVWLEGAPRPGSGQAPKAVEPPKSVRSLVNANCRFEPHVQTMTVGEELRVENRDPLLHNTHPVYLGDKSTLFNVALPEQGQEVRKKVRRPGVVKVQCDAGHVWMRAFVHVFDHPYHAVTGADGAFLLGDIPPGKYTLKLWHEAAGTLSQPVEIAAAVPLQQDFTFDASSPQ